MKKNTTIAPILHLVLLFTLAGVMFFGCRKASGQTITNMPAFASTITSDPTISGGLQEIYNATLDSTNFAVALGGGRSLKGGNTLAFADYIYNFNENVGAVLGYDYLWSSTKGQASSANFVKGGLNLQAPIKPFKNFGATNFTVTPFGSLLMSSGNGQVGQIEVGGINYETPMFWGIRMNLGGFYENRSGNDSPYNGAYLCGHIAISKGF